MEGLLRFIAEHPAVLVILLALLGPAAGLLQRLTGAPARGERKPAPMPSFGGGPGERKQASAGRPVAKGSGLGAPVRKEEAVASEEAEAYRKRPDVLADPPARNRASVPGGAPSAASAPMSPMAEASAPDREDLVRAVMWSEILGPPRSKRPYRRS